MVQLWISLLPILIFLHGSLGQTADDTTTTDTLTTAVPEVDDQQAVYNIMADLSAHQMTEEELLANITQVFNEYFPNGSTASTPTSSESTTTEEVVEVTTTFEDTTTTVEDTTTSEDATTTEETTAPADHPLSAPHQVYTIMGELAEKNLTEEELLNSVSTVFSDFFGVTTTTTEKPFTFADVFNWGPFANDKVEVTRPDVSLEYAEQKPCPDNWIRYKQSCYLYEHTLFTFDEAVERCAKDYNGTLFVPNTVEEWDTIRFLSPKTFYSWIGLKLASEQGQLKWQTSDAIDAENINWLMKPFTSAKNGFTTASGCVSHFNPAFAFKSISYTFFQFCAHPTMSICERNSTVLQMLGHSNNLSPRR